MKRHTGYERQEESLPKTLKTEPGAAADFSGAVKKKLTSSARTGQACDRCKVRKIRCDVRAGGCSPCAQNNSECKTTDRITGRATSRGHIEQVEQECNSLRVAVDELQQQLRENGIEPKALSGHAPATNHSTSYSYRPEGLSGASSEMSSPRSYKCSLHTSQRRDTRDGSDARLTEPAVFGTLKNARSGCSGDTYLGVSSGSSYLSIISGTSLSVFGMEIDLADYVPELDDPASPRSYRVFVEIFTGLRSVQELDFPPEKECLEYVGYYLRALNPYIPILHKPTIMDLLDKIYHEPGYQPTLAQRVIVHMTLGIIKYQYASRALSEHPTQKAAMDASSDVHYHYALSIFARLFPDPTVENLQAMALICYHLRNFPLPGPAWQVTHSVFGMVVEQGLHRCADAWVDAAPKNDILEVEMRKRVFWAVLALCVGLSGTLGRPMPLHVEDFDTDVPIPMHDYLPHESGLSEHRKCSFRIGIESFKIVRLFLKTYSTVYAIRQPPNYEATVRELEIELQQWRKQLPQAFSERATQVGKQEDRIFALYVHTFEHEIQFLLHHPAIHKATAPDVLRRNLDICLDVANKELQICSQLRSFKSLDITLYRCTVYISYIFTTLFAHWERREELIASTLNKLSEDMAAWLEIIGDVGKLLGMGLRLQCSIRKIVDSTLSHLQRHLVTKTATAAVASVGLTPARSRSPAPGDVINANGFHPTNVYGSRYREGTDPGISLQGTSHTNQYLRADDPANQLHQTYSHPSNAFAYHDPSTASASSYQQASYPFDPTKYDFDPQQHSPAQAHPGASTYHHALGSAPGAAQYPAMPMSTYGDAGAWRQWTYAMRRNLQDPQDYLSSANALMALGGNDGAAGVTQNGGEVNLGHLGLGGPGTWPMNVFDIGHAGS